MPRELKQGNDFLGANIVTHVWHGFHLNGGCHRAGTAGFCHNGAALSAFPLSDSTACQPSRHYGTYALANCSPKSSRHDESLKPPHGRITCKSEVKLSDEDEIVQSKV